MEEIYSKSIIIGTSGHIDHGKTSLIKALNGFDGDDMQEEKDRHITINLSFSNMSDENTNIAFIDVPGHENLLKNMICGAFGFDFAMIVVAANEGVMPQTKEHIQILSILNIKNIILVITKCDIADLNQQHSTEKQALKLINSYNNLRVVKSHFVSIFDRDSIENLKMFLFSITPKKTDEDKILKYYIDRSFSLKGIGTVVTGTLTHGKIKDDDKLFCLDNNKFYNIKSIQIHENFTSVAYATNRVAINLSNTSVEELKKGFIFSKKGYFRGFDSIDAVFLGDILHNDEVVFCIGSINTSAKVLKISQQDKECFVTFKFKRKIFANFQERFVVLKNSRVIGGGWVLNPINDPLKKPQKIKLLQYLRYEQYLEAFNLLASIHKHGFGLISSFQRFNMMHDKALEIANNLNQNFIIDSKDLCIYPYDALKDVKDFVKFIISKNQNAVFSVQSIKLRLNWAGEMLINKALNELLDEKIIQNKDTLFIKYGQDIDKVKDYINNQILTILEKEGIRPRAPYNIYEELDITKEVGDNVLKNLTKSKKVIRLEHNLFITEQNLSYILEKMRQIIKIHSKINVSILKQSLNLSRKFAISYLEFLDKFDDIKRIGDDRLIQG